MEQKGEAGATTLQPLRWLAGTWQGTEKGQNPFVEGYEFMMVRRWRRALR